MRGLDEKVDLEVGIKYVFTVVVVFHPSPMLVCE